MQKRNFKNGYDNERKRTSDKNGFKNTKKRQDRSLVSEARESYHNFDNLNKRNKNRNVSKRNNNNNNNSNNNNVQNTISGTTSGSTSVPITTISTTTLAPNSNETDGGNSTLGGQNENSGDSGPSHSIFIFGGIIVAAVVILLAAMGFFFFRWYRQRQLKKTLQDNYKTRMKGKKRLGIVDYILKYNYLEAKLDIEILQVKNITLSNKQDVDMKEFATYMRVYLVPEMDQQHETKIVTKTLNPQFNQTFNFKCLVDDLDKCRILLRLYQHHKFLRDMPIGDGIVELLKDELRLGFASVPMYAYNPALDDPLGEVCMSLRYNPTTSKLSVTIIECRNLKSMDWNGKADPYVKIILKIRDKIIYKDKTAIKKCTLNPYFNTIFSFKIPPTKIPLVDLLLIVKDYDLLGSNDEIGSVRLGIEPDSEAAERQWNNMIENLKRPQTEWHHLMPQEDTL